MSERRLLLVVGSVNYDLIFRHAKIPGPGEGVTRAELVRSCGGKGANQAVVAARCARCSELADVAVAFAGAIGDDDFGAEQREALVADGIDVSYLEVVPGIYTGTSSVWVETGSGENRILNASGANLWFLPQHAERLPYGDAALVLLQNEIPAATGERVAALARQHRVPLIWNPAPMAGADVPDLDPGLVRFLTPNESEAAALLGIDLVRDPASCGKALLTRGYSGVVLTLGAAGVLVLADGLEARVPAPSVEAVDTTGAGDAFNGAFAAALVAGYDVLPAARFAVHYASESVRYPGTQTAFPKQVPGAARAALGGLSR